MELTHEFTVPASVEETWAALGDIEGVAGCFPGASITSVEGDTFHGSCKVKLGPIALVYNGSGTFVTRDDATHTMTIEAKGKDKRGNGTAGADVTASMEAVEGGTTVRVVTELAITGKPAQFGRGVMQDVSDKLLGQFVDCLQTRVGAPAAEPEPEQAAATPTAAAQAPSAEPAAGAEPTPAASAAPATSAAPSPPKQDDALDLGATALPVLVKHYGKPVAIAVAVVVLIIILWRSLA